MSEKEWHPSYPDWSKETRCIQCRFPKRQFGFFYDELKWITCRTCKYIEIKICKECKEEMGLCTRFAHINHYNPPSKEEYLDKKRLCKFYEERV